MARWHAVRPFADVPQGLTEVEVGQELVLLIRKGDDLQACSAVCPHKFTGLATGTLENGCLTCPMHEASFDLKSGHPQQGQEWAGVLPLFDSRVHEGVVEVRLPDQP